MTRYRVTAPTAILGHEPGSVFEATVDERQERRLLERGQLTIVSSRGREHDLGRGFTLSEYLDDAGGLIGYFVTGPAAPACKSSWNGRCGGLAGVRPHSEGGQTYSVWKASGEWPKITLHPSVACSCNGQHAFVRDGRWG